MRIIFIFLMMLIMAPLALADWFYNSQSITVDIGIYSEPLIVKSSPRGYVDSATINLTFYPRETESQEIMDFKTYPEADIGKNVLSFSWKNPEDRLDFRVDAYVRTKNTLIPIKKKLEFPIESLPEEVREYTRPSPTIDSGNKDISRLASELVEGEDDLYAAVFSIAEWTKNNINYDLSTLTAEVSQKASWVLENRKGVCDELTSLFIALLRAVGVPARFVSGVAYTNSELFPEKWGPHGWAEVYFPEYGWVPFDITYGEYGWVDPTHIKFKESVDSDEPSTYYQWLGKDADLDTKKLDIKTELVSKTGNYRPPLSLKPEVLRKSVSFGSYNLLEVSVENPNDFYYATELSLATPKEVMLIGHEMKSVLLAPNEKKKIFWILKTDNGLNKKYSYTFPLQLTTTNNITFETSFAANIRSPFVSLEYVENAARLLEEEKEKKYSANVIFNCSASKDESYIYEDAKISCYAKNAGNVYLEGIEICFEGKCNSTDLGISQSGEFAFEVDKSAAGNKQGIITIRNELVSKSQAITYTVLDKPRISISSVEFPPNVSYNQNFTVSFTIAKESLSMPRDVVVVLSQNWLQKKWNIKELNEDRRFLIGLNGDQLQYAKNSYRIDISYIDELSQPYNVDYEFSIDMVNATMLQRISSSLLSLDRLSHESMALMLFAGTAAFLAVVLILFRKSKRPRKV